MEQRSEFVTVVAWIFIVFSGLGVLITAGYLAVFWSMPFSQFMQQNQQLTPGQLRTVTAIVSGFFRWSLAIALLLQAWMLASSIGLLLRKNWARISFIVLMAIGLFWNGIGLIFGLFAMVGMHAALHSATMPAGMPPGFQGMMQAFMLVVLIMDIAFLVLFGWIIKKLVSEDIRREFLTPPEHSGVLMG